MNKIILFVLLFLASGLMAQPNQDESQHPPKEHHGQVTVKGCVGRSSGHDTLMGSDSNNSYVLEASSNLDVGHYLGQQVQVTGSESQTLSTSSSSMRAGTGPPITITADSIKVISRRCSH